MYARPRTSPGCQNGPKDPRSDGSRRSSAPSRNGSPIHSLRTLLRSRLHWPLSRWLVLVSYEGRRTGRRYAFPAVYDQQGDSVVVVTPIRESNWWKNFVEPYRCTVWLRGSERSVVGELVTDDDRRGPLEGYLETHGFVGRLLGIPDAADRSADRNARSTDGLGVVRFSPQKG